ncbi:CHASE2 domain-containing protein [Aquibium oceanicum]|uniref:Adenylate/guanylate cyclase domain-containing protein n=1 Tax=Aquibium oceanicum TaxID=1670800 RepID=A0A1L3SL08_9HYPH|nr:adenylate/guanylate cyclase domain-containing protein [Aquibium oceanicum]APH70104.1 adenylate/guanylate cyclase domain-containing protein [Aquibium oceanicum]
MRAASPDRRRRAVAITAAIAFATVTLLSLTSPWRLFEARLFDYFSTVMPPPLPADGPVVIAIDEPSFAELGLQWPWPRDVHARLVEALRQAGASAIGLDIIFAEPSNEQADAALADAMGSDVTLAADVTRIETAQADQVIRVEPIPSLIEGGARAGLSSIVLDRDGTLRRLPPYPDGFAATILESIGADAPATPPGALIQTFGPSRTYPTISYYQALDPETFLPPDTLRGRIAIVGLSLQSAPTVEGGGADAYATSWTPRTGRLIAGAELQATILDNLRHGLFIRPAPFAAVIAANLLGAMLAAYAVWGATGWRTIAGSLLAVGVFAVGYFLLLRFGRIHFPPLGPTLAFVGTALAQGAQDYASERKLRKSVTRAFSQYLSPALVEKLARDPSRLKLGGEKRTITILFCDVRGFTTIAESMKDDPEKLTALVNRLLNPLSEAVLEAGGTIDKYIGDAIMAFWNAPLDDPDHAVHAVEAGLAMIRAVEPLNRELAAEAGNGAPIRFAIGVGVNTGECVVGNMGSDRRFDYSALGDAVNLASRLEGRTKDYGTPLLVGDETARHIRDRIDLVEVDRISVKGKAEAVTVWTVASLMGARPIAAVETEAPGIANLKAVP